jgi:hypothetical protein
MGGGICSQHRIYATPRTKILTKQRFKHQVSAAFWFRFGQHVCSAYRICAKIPGPCPEIGSSLRHHVLPVGFQVGLAFGFPFVFNLCERKIEAYSMDFE